MQSIKGTANVLEAGEGGGGEAATPSREQGGQAPQQQQPLVTSILGRGKGLAGTGGMGGTSGGRPPLGPSRLLRRESQSLNDRYLRSRGPAATASATGSAGHVAHVLQDGVGPLATL